jgi:succinate dehydrogenase / fumarate reductase membrane anchor subunit
MKGSAGWLLQRISGLLLIAGLIVHFTVMHYSGPAQITYAFVLRRISNPWWKAFDLTFLGLLIYHGLIGVRGIAVEYVRSGMVLRVVQGVLAAMAVILFATGVYIVTTGGA